MATNPKKKYNKSADILAFLRDNPTIRSIVAAQRFGITVASVYKYRRQMAGAGPNTVLHLVPDMEVKGTEEDMVNSPSHYTDGGIETIDFIRAKLTEEEFRGYCTGNALKYLSRAGKKGSGAEDLQKAQWYLRAITREG